MRGHGDDRGMGYNDLRPAQDSGSFPMAVQKHRKTRSRRDMRRSHHALAGPTLSADPVTGTRHRRHHLAADGFYRGRQVHALPLPKEEPSDADA